MARGEILPAVEGYVKEVAKTALLKKDVSEEISCAFEKGLLKKLSMITESISSAIEELEKGIELASQKGDIVSESICIRDVILSKMNELRVAADEAEVLTAKKYWPFPTYGDLLFGVR